MTLKKIIAALAAGLAAAELTKRQQQSILLPVLNEVKNSDDEWLRDFLRTSEDSGGQVLSVSAWVPPESADPYLGLLRQAEERHGLPENLLARVAYQESRFRDDIINGETVSSAGAVGIMQIVPRWHPSVDPLNVPDAIDYAASYLASLKASTGSWEMALAAYNWGPGNLSRKGFSQAPKETRDYVAQISEDVLRGYA